MRRSCTAIIALGFVPPATAQRPPWLKEPYLRPAIYGQLIDSATGKPIAYAGLNIHSKSGLAFSDSLGWYLLFDMPTGKQVIEFRCPAKRTFVGRRFTTRTITISGTTDSNVTFTLDLSRCVEPPIETRTGEFTGRYVPGFESSRFTPCRPFADLRGTAYEGYEGYAWVTFDDSVLNRARAKWPDSGRDPYPPFFVRWKGTLTGPGGYGHLGVSSYLLRVSEILEMRKAAKADCQGNR